METPVEILPKADELIQADYDEKWFSDASIRKLDEEYLMQVKEGLSPFKAEIASYIKRNCVVVDKYKAEIEMLTKLSEKI